MNYMNISHDILTDKEKAGLSKKQKDKLREQRTKEYVKAIQEEDPDSDFYIDELVTSLIPFIRSIAIEVVGPTDADELMADGLIALDRSIYKFDTDRQVKFSTYCYPAIKNEIMYSDLLFDGISRFPHHVKDMSKKIAVAKVELLQELYREPTIEEIADHIGIDRESVKEFELYSNYDSKNSVNLDHPIGDSENLYHDKVGTEDDQYNTLDDIDFIQEIMDHLDPEERDIIGYTYGILGYDKLTGSEIIEALNLGIVDSQLTRRKKIILEKMKNLSKHL